MLNPQNVHECEKEKRRNPREVIDTIMTCIGLIASLSSIPQVLKIWETGNVAGISLTTQIVALGAVVSWLLYGMYIENKPLVITSGLSALVLSTVVAQILWHL